MKINSVITVPTTIDNFFRYWFEFTKPLHKLSDRVIDVMTEFIKYRYELKDKIKDTELLDKVVMSKETKSMIRKKLGMTESHFQVVMTKLKKARVIENGKINPRYIPKLIDTENFQLLISFNLKDA